MRTRVALDFEDGDTSYSLTVTAADPSNESASVVVTITVTNADEAGTVTLTKVQPIFDQELMATLTDPDCFGSNETWLVGKFFERDLRLEHHRGRLRILPASGRR